MHVRPPANIFSASNKPFFLESRHWCCMEIERSCTVSQQPHAALQLPFKSKSSLCPSGRTGGSQVFLSRARARPVLELKISWSFGYRILAWPTSGASGSAASGVPGSCSVLLFRQMGGCTTLSFCFCSAQKANGCVSQSQPQISVAPLPP